MKKNIFLLLLVSFSLPSHAASSFLGFGSSLTNAERKKEEIKREIGRINKMTLEELSSFVIDGIFSLDAEIAGAQIEEAEKALEKHMAKSPSVAAYYFYSLLSYVDTDSHNKVKMADGLMDANNSMPKHKVVLRKRKGIEEKRKEERKHCARLAREIREDLEKNHGDLGGKERERVFKIMLDRAFKDTVTEKEEKNGLAEDLEEEIGAKGKRSSGGKVFLGIAGVILVLLLWKSNASSEDADFGN